MPTLRGVAAGAAMLGGGYATWLLSGWGGDAVIRIVDDAGLVVFAAFAGVCAALAAVSAAGKERAAWVSLSVGAFGWASGEAVWTYQDLTGQRSFPSWPDVGFVVFVLGAGLCLAFLVLARPSSIRFRLALDWMIVGAALFGAAWVTLLNPVHAAWAGSPAATAVALAYPMGDIALSAMAAMLLISAPAAARPILATLTAGFVLITLSDTVFGYLTAVGGFGDTHFIATGWAWGFLCLGMSALMARVAPAGTAVQPKRGPIRVALWAPYVAVAVSAAICTPVLLGGLGPVFVAAALTVTAVVARQFLVIADNRRLLGEVADQALRDPLTGLANRTLFQERLSNAVYLHQRHSMAVAVLLMDLDHFGAVNDGYGHPAGDAILVRVAERLAGAVPGGNTVARFGGDEFAVLLVGDADAAHTLAHRVVGAFARPFVIADQELVVRPSVGLAVAPAEESDITGDQLLVRAGVAMRSAKASPSHAPVVFAADTAAPAPAVADCDAQPGSARLLEELRTAIQHHGLCVVYQPKFDLLNYDVVGLEALVRWPHPRRGLLTPAQFLPLVRQHGLMRSLTTEVLELALDEAARWYGKGVGVPVAVNVFATAISDPELPDQIADALDRRGLPAEALVIEITEDLMLDNMGKTRIVLKSLRDKGIRVAIDDFGSGCSALWYLREFPVDEVKLDREFVGSIMTHPPSAAIVRSVIDLAHTLGVTPVAEGVENAETVTQLLEYGCEVGQGYLFSPPLPAAAVEKLLTAQNGARSLRIGRSQA